MRRVIASNSQPDSKEVIYSTLQRLMQDYQVHPSEQHPFKRLLNLTDEALATYMAIAKASGRILDRNSFLKREELIDDTAVLQATAAAGLQLPKVAKDIKQLMS